MEPRAFRPGGRSKTPDLKVRGSIYPFSIYPFSVYLFFL